jgi:HEAT repeat protein
MCELQRIGKAETYVEKLMETVFSPDPTRVGMAIDVLVDWLHEPRAVTPLLMLLQADVDVHRLVMAARGLGGLGDRAAIPLLSRLLSDPTKPFVARIAAAKSLGQLGGATAETALRLAANDERPSVAQAVRQALTGFR